MEKPGGIHIDKVVLDCADPAKLSDFYCKLLGWTVMLDPEGHPFCIDPA